ncbi:MAG TPA: hypothetical protein ENI31_06640 [Candidatus Omnitrophica bacterium]|nr:hypothetical protein [Candidatus Omnitrophota bacterium]
MEKLYQNYLPLVESVAFKSQIAKELRTRRERMGQAKQLLLRKIKINQKLTENLYAVNRLSV